MFEYKKDYDFKFYSIFSSFIVFIVFMFVYSDFWVNLILAVMVYLFFSITHFVWNLIKKIGGIVSGKGKGI